MLRKVTLLIFWSITTCSLSMYAGELVTDTTSSEFKVISDRNVTVNVDLSTATLRLSGAGYAVEVVKVLVPELADVTLLNHRNPGEEAPCLATFETREPSDVIQDNPETIAVALNIKLGKSLSPLVAEKLCQVTLTEEVTGQIRGFNFYHFRTHDLENRPLEDCR